MTSSTTVNQYERPEQPGSRASRQRPPQSPCDAHRGPPCQTSTCPTRNPTGAASIARLTPAPVLGGQGATVDHQCQLAADLLVGWQERHQRLVLQPDPRDQTDREPAPPAVPKRTHDQPGQRRPRKEVERAGGEQVPGGIRTSRSSRPAPPRRPRRRRPAPTRRPAVGVPSSTRPRRAARAELQVWSPAHPRISVSSAAMPGEG
jgi:hypothetical protein